MRPKNYMNLPFMRYKTLGGTFVRFVTIHAFDGQTDRQSDRRTDGQTDRNICRRKDRPACMQRGKSYVLPPVYMSMVWYGMVYVNLYIAIVANGSNALMSSSIIRHTAIIVN